jgi:hypothetical protein
MGSYGTSLTGASASKGNKATWLARRRRHLDLAVPATSLRSVDCCLLGSTKSAAALAELHSIDSMCGGPH